MEKFLDTLWSKIEILVHLIKDFLDIIFNPLNSLGPAVAISIIALITVVITKYLTKKFKTKRYRGLQKQFLHWYNLRKEALKCKDPEKAKLLARNIDQAKLNRVYYDYFFEGLLNSLLTRYIPILLALAYVNDAYRPANLLKLSGREYILKFGDLNGEAIAVGAVCWFVLSILLVYVAWFIVGKLYSKNRPS